MMNLREFLRKNNLKQVEIARYLCVTEAAISNAVKGKSRFSNENLIKIINNPYGWDVSMLTQSEAGEPVLSQSEAGEPVQEQNDILIAELRSQIEKLQAKVDSLNQELGEKNALLKMLRQGGGNSAPDAGCSSSANVG